VIQKHAGLYIHGPIWLTKEEKTQDISSSWKKLFGFLQEMVENNRTALIGGVMRKGQRGYYYDTF